MHKVKRPKPKINKLISIQYPLKSVIFSEGPAKKKISDEIAINMAAYLFCNPDVFISKIRENPNLILSDSIVQLAIRLYQQACEQLSFEDNSKILMKAGIPIFIPDRKKGRPRKRTNITRERYNKLKRFLSRYGLSNYGYRELRALWKEYDDPRNKKRRLYISSEFQEKVKMRMKHAEFCLNKLGVKIPTDLNERLKMLGILAYSSNAMIAQILLTNAFRDVSERTFKNRLKESNYLPTSKKET